MLTRLLLTALLSIIPTAAHAQGALLVVTKQSHALAIVDGATLRVLARVASNAGSGTMSVFNRTELKPVTVPGAPPVPAAYTAPGWKHTLIPVGKAAEGFAVSPDEREVWVGNEDGTVSIIDLNAEKVEASIAADVRGANRLQFTPDGRLLLVTTHTGKDLVVIDPHTRQVVKRIAIEQRGASGIQVQPDGSRAFVACPRDHFVAVVDLHQLVKVAQIDAGREPDGLAWWAR